MKTDPEILNTHLATLRLPFLKEHCQPLAATAAKNSITHLDYLAQLIQGEADLRADRAVARRIHSARFPVIKTLDTFRWDWPKKINRLQIQDLFRLQFIEDHANVILLGTVGLGKTHLATALGYAACQQGMHVLFANAIAAACDFSGKIVWKRDFKETHGAFATQWTYGSSPTIDSGKLYIQVLQRNETFKFQDKFEKGTPGKDLSSYILAIDPANGKDIWKQIRPSTAKVESLEAFSSPVFATYKDQRLMLISGGDTLTIPDAATGKAFSRFATWNPPGEGYNSFFRLVPSPVIGDGMAIVCAPKNSPIFAIPLDAKGETQPVWQTEPKGVTSDVPTPAFYKGHFYVLDGGKKILSCVEPKTGKVVWTGELGGKTKFESSPTVADDKVYCINFWGEVYVAKANTDKFELLGMNEMGDGSKPNGNAASVRASISVSDSSLFIRTQDKLYRVGK